MIYCIISVLLMGAGSVFQELIIASSLSAKSIIFFSNFFSFLLFSCILLFEDKKKISLFHKEMYKLPFILSILFTSLGSALLIFSIETSGAYTTALFGRLYVPYCLLLSSPLLFRVSKTDLVVVGIVLLSTSLFFWDAGHNEKPFRMIVFFPSLCFALSHIFITRMQYPLHKELIVISSFVSALAFCGEAPSIFHLMQTASTKTLFLFLFSCVLPTSLGIFLYLKALTNISVSLASSVRSLTPIVTWITYALTSTYWGTPLQIFAYFLLLLPPLLKLQEHRKELKHVQTY